VTRRAPRHLGGFRLPRKQHAWWPSGQPHLSARPEQTSPAAHTRFTRDSPPARRSVQGACWRSRATAANSTKGRQLRGSWSGRTCSGAVTQRSYILRRSCVHSSDMLRLQLSAVRFAAPTTTLVDVSVGAAPPESWSLISEAARCRVHAHTAEQRAWVPRRGRESWLGLLWELERLCLPLAVVLS
jgi:hypothetical protein